MANAGDKKTRSNRRRATAMVQKRVTPEQKAAFEARARDAGYDSGHAYLEAFILGREAIARRDRENLVRILAELGKQGSNLNQLARAINSGRIANLSANQLQDVISVIITARSAVTLCSKDLRGWLS